MLYIVIFLLSFLFSVLFTKIIKKIASLANFYDRPHTELKTHSEPVPYAGSSIWLAFMVVMVGLRIFTSYETGTLHQIRGIVYGGGIIFLLGLVDDIIDLHYIIKFIGQVIAVVMLIRFNIYIKLFPHSAINYILSVFWVILVINAINIIDVMDGLAPGVAALAAAGFFLVALPTEKLYVNFTALILLGVLAGFWLYNRPEAKVFMGDAGSLFTGFILAACSMGADYSSQHLVGLFAPFLILGVPVYDTLLVSYFRHRKGKSVFKGSPDHYALRLKNKGLTVWQINMVSYAVTLILCLGAFSVTVLDSGYAILIIIALLFLGVIGVTVLTEPGEIQ